MGRLGCFAALIALFTAIATDSWTQSRKFSEPNNQAAQPAAPDQRGTEQIPLVVKVLPSQPSEEQTKKEDAEKHEKSEIDRKLAFETQRIADYTDRLALFTVFLFCVAVSQAGLFVWQLFYMRRGMDDAKLAAEAAKAAAEATKLQASAIISAQRPYVFLKVQENGIKFNLNGTFEYGTERFKFELRNYGRTPALLLELKEKAVVVAGVTDAPKPLNPMKDRGRLLPAGTIAPANGADRTMAYNLLGDAENFQSLLNKDAWKNCRLFFCGFVRFRDTFGNNYITGFQMVFSPIHNAWALRGGEEYNYARQEIAVEIPQHPDYPNDKL